MSQRCTGRLWCVLSFTCDSLCVKWTVFGASGQSGLPAPGRAGPSPCPATGAAAAPSQRREGPSVLESRKCTAGWESRSRDSPAPSSASVRVSVGHTRVFLKHSLLLFIEQSTKAEFERKSRFSLFKNTVRCTLWIRTGF